MKIIQQSFKLEREEYYKVHLSILNILLPVKLTEKEVEVLSTFMSLPYDVVIDDYFNPVARKVVMDKCNIKPGGLSNHIKSMAKKGFIYKNDITRRFYIKDFLLPEDEIQGYQIKLMNTQKTSVEIGK